MAEELELLLLGDVQVRRAGAPVTGFRSRKTLALLCYLAVTGRPHERPALAGLLWGELPEASAQNNLRKTLTYLRRLVEPHLEITRHAVAFDRESPYWLDVEAFGEACRAADVERLERAVELYRGDFMEGFYLRDAPAFEEWALAQQARLREGIAQALHTLAVHHARRGELGHAASIGYTTRLLALEPWREEAHRQLMTLLARSGQRGAALAQYEACRQMLAEELGVEPGPETTALYEQIRKGAVRPAVAAKGAVIEPPPASVEALHHNLPAQLTPFIGRKALLAEIAERLADPACRLLTLVGPGGSGTTRLALEAAAGQLDRFADGVFFVSLAPLGSAEAIVPTIAGAIGHALHAGDVQKQLLDYLRGKEMLLVLDDYEHLLEGVKVAVDILQAAPGIRILATSRIVLNAHGEHMLDVPGMAYPSLGPTGPSPKDREPARDLALALQEAQRYSAVQLFVSSARRQQPGFALTADNLPHVVRTCRLLSGMPLGIVLAASWIALLSPAEIAHELESQGPAGGLDFLETDLQDVPARQRSMRAVFDHSWKLLTARERDVMQALSVFRGGCTREAAQEVAGASLRDLRSLLQRSLLHRTPAGRIEVHELLRQYAAEQLDRASSASQGEPRGTAVRDRHCAYYMTALAGWEAELKGARHREVLSEMDAEFDNVRVAWKWAVEQGHVEDLERTAEGLSLYCELRSRDLEGETAFQAAADKVEGTCELEGAGSGAARWGAGISVEHLLAVARMRIWQGLSAWRWQHTEVARRALRQGMELLDRPELADCDTRLERGVLLFTWGQLGFDIGREDVRQRIEESLILFRALDNRWWAGRALFWLGILANEASEYGSARRHYEESLAAFQAQGDPRWSAQALGFTGVAYLWQGQVEQGERMVRECLASMQALGDRAGIAGALEGMSFAACLAGRFAEAEAWMERCLAIWDDLGTRRTTVMQNAGRVYMHLGRYQHARALGQQELALVQQRDQHRIAGMYLDFLGTASLPLEPYEQAHRWLQEALVIFQRFEMRGWRANTEAVTGYAARAIGRPDQAKGHLVESLRLARELESWWPVALALPAIALLLADRGQVERAVELYTLASRYPYVANSRWYEDVAGHEIAVAAESLPRDILVRAQERGRTRDLWATVEELLAE